MTGRKNDLIKTQVTVVAGSDYCQDIDKIYSIALRLRTGIRHMILLLSAMIGIILAGLGRLLKWQRL